MITNSIANLENLERTTITMLHHTWERERASCGIYLWIAWSLDSSITLHNRQLDNPTIYSIITWLWCEENFNKQSITTSVGKFGENPEKKTIAHLWHHTFKAVVLASSQISQKLVIQFDNPTEHGGLWEISKYTERILTLYIKFSSFMSANKFSKLQCCRFNEMLYEIFFCKIALPDWYATNLAMALKNIEILCLFCYKMMWKNCRIDLITI